MKEQHLKVLAELGFLTEGRKYKDVVADLIEEHIKLMVEVEKNNLENFKESVRRLQLPSN